MNTYKRNIKFCYYKIVEVENFGTKQERIKGKYNLVNWLMKINDKHEINRNVELADCMVNFEQVYFYEEDEIYVIRVYKLRDINIPSKVKDGEKAKELDLESDEYIGEDLTFLFDRKNGVCMLQQNRMSIGVKRLEEWINKTCSIENGRIAFFPIIDKFTAKGLGNKKIRCIEFSFVNSDVGADDSSLAQIIKGFNKYDATAGHITISVGRYPKAQLAKDCSTDLIDDLQSNPGIVNSARVKLKTEKIRDDDKAHIEIVDLFENSVHDFISFDIEAKKTLSFDKARREMYNKYMERRGSIVSKCKW